MCVCSSWKVIQSKRIQIEENYTFGDRLTSLLLYNALTQKEFANRIGVDAANVNRWCNGHTEPHMRMIPLICKVLNTSADRLFGIIVTE